LVKALMEAIGKRSAKGVFIRHDVTVLAGIWFCHFFLSITTDDYYRSHTTCIMEKERY
jgi:hypothetical protein